MSKDLYEVLQVSPNAEPVIIEAAYRRLARKYHPDMDSSPGATLRMQEINWAYELLQDPSKRSEYDRTRRAWQAAGPSQPRAHSRQHQTARTTPKYETTPTPEGRDTSQTKRQSPGPLPEPSSLSSVLLGSVLLAIYYLVSLLFGLAAIISNTAAMYGLMALSIGGSALLAIAAAAGWNPRRITVGRVLLLWPLTAFAISSWIPCYLAGKAIARKTLARRKDTETESLPDTSTSRWPIIAYGLIGIMLSVLVFGDVLDERAPAVSDLEFDRYRNSEIGVAFDHPVFLFPEATTNKERTDAGTVFSVSTISAESSNPTLALGLRIIEAPLRNEMFPELYPPSDDALRILLIGDLADYQFSEDEVSQEQLLSASQESSILQVSGYPAAEYSLSAKDTMIGDALLRGALIVTDRRDVSVFLLGSVEAGVEGSFTNSQVETIWKKLLDSLVLDY